MDERELVAAILSKLDIDEPFLTKFWLAMKIKFIADWVAQYPKDDLMAYDKTQENKDYRSMDFTNYDKSVDFASSLAVNIAVQFYNFCRKNMHPSEKTTPWDLNIKSNFYDPFFPEVKDLAIH
jgi:hypothetical protein